jgi:cytochrome c-type biogenesis protein CcmI
VIEAVIVVVLAAGLLAWVLVPVLRGPRAAPDESPGAEDAAVRKSAALDALIDLEEDRAVGKLTRADFESLRADYEAEALEALRELDAAARTRSDDELLEAEIAAARREVTCPRCGRIRPEDGPCPQCDD